VKRLGNRNWTAMAPGNSVWRYVCEPFCALRRVLGLQFTRTNGATEQWDVWHGNWLELACSLHCIVTVTFCLSCCHDTVRM